MAVRRAARPRPRSCRAASPRTRSRAPPRAKPSGRRARRNFCRCARARLPARSRRVRLVPDSVPDDADANQIEPRRTRGASARAPSRASRSSRARRGVSVVLVDRTDGVERLASWPHGRFSDLVAPGACHDARCRPWGRRCSARRRRPSCSVVPSRAGARARASRRRRCRARLRCSRAPTAPTTSTSCPRRCSSCAPGWDAPPRIRRAAQAAAARDRAPRRHADGEGDGGARGRARQARRAAADRRGAGQARRRDRGVAPARGRSGSTSPSVPERRGSPR